MHYIPITYVMIHLLGVTGTHTIFFFFDVEPVYTPLLKVHKVKNSSYGCGDPCIVLLGSRGARVVPGGYPAGLK